MSSCRPMCTTLLLICLSHAASSQAPPAATAALGLDAITAQALAVSPAARTARQRLAETQAGLAAANALGRLQPSFTGSVGGSYGEVAQPISYQTFYTLIGTINLPFPNARRLSAQSAQARGLVRAAQAGLDRARLILTFRASDAYYGLLRANGAEIIASENLTQAVRFVADAKNRADTGDIPAADVLKAQVPESQARAALARARNAVRLAQQALNSLIGRQLNVPITPADPPALPPLTLTREQAVSRALANSPDVREAQANQEAAEAGLQVTRRQRDPEYSAQAGYTRTSDITAYSYQATVTLSVTLPLGDSGLTRQQVKQAQAQVEQARAALALAQQQTELAVEQAFLDVASNEANLVATQDTARIAQDSLDKAREAFAAGLTTTRDVLDAQQALAQARNDVNAARYDLALSRARLTQAIGE